MNPVAAADLAKYLPIPVNQVVFQFEIALDSTYQAPSLSGVWPPLDLTQLPQQVYVDCIQHPGGQRHFVGVNVFQDGTDIKYQPFFWAGGSGAVASPPPKGQLDSAGNWQQAGAPCVLSKANPQEADVDLSAAGSSNLRAAVLPLFCTFNHTSSNPVVSAQPASPSPKITQLTPASSDGKKDVITIQGTYSETQTFQFSNTHTYSVEFGATAGIEGGVSWFGLVDGKFSLQTSFKFSFSTASTNLQSTAQLYQWQATIKLPLDAGETGYAVVLVYADDNAAATISLDSQLSGSINGQPMSGTFLQQLVGALDALQTPPLSTVITNVGPNNLTYTATGTVTANVVFNCYAGAFFGTPPTLDQVVADAASKMASGDTTNTGTSTPVKPGDTTNTGASTPVNTAPTVA